MTAAVVGFTSSSNVLTKRNQHSVSFVAAFSAARNVTFSTSYDFKDFPMDEISRSLNSGDISIPANLKTAEELDEWIMSL